MRANGELLIILVALVALALAPLASRLVRLVGNQISAELDGGRTGEQLAEHLDSSTGLSPAELAEEEIRQMREALASKPSDEA